MKREDVTFESSSSRCAAWFYRPDGAGPFPIVVMGHGLAATRDERMDAYAERFAAAGMAVLAFDYRHFGASEGQPRQLVSVSRQHADWRRAIDFAKTLPGVDRSRVALWGSSFSGGHVTVVAAGRDDIAAVVTQCPAMDCLAAVTQMPLAQILKLTAAGMRDGLHALVAASPHYIPAIGAPGSAALMQTADAEPGYRAIVAGNSLWRNEIAARLMLTIALYRPVQSARRVSAAFLVAICTRDKITPPAAAERAAKLAPKGEARRYDLGHFDIYLGEAFERAVADQIEFLQRHLNSHLRLGAAAEAQVA